MSERPTDWLAVLDRLIAGDRLALLEFNRLLTGFLTQMRAYDFRDEWDDLRQEVLLAVVANHRAGRLRDPKAFTGYVRIVTRNKFVDRLKRTLRLNERESLPWDDECARAAVEPDREEARALWSAVDGLEEEQRLAVVGVYREGRTYEEVSRDTGIPLGTLKRRLRQGLDLLRSRLEPGLAEPGGGSESEDG